MDRYLDKYAENVKTPASKFRLLPNGKLHGSYIELFNGNKRLKCTYKNGELHGQFIKYLYRR